MTVLELENKLRARNSSDIVRIEVPGTTTRADVYEAFGVSIRPWGCVIYASARDLVESVE